MQTGTGPYSAVLLDDEEGLWLHHFVWGQDSGGMYDASNWYTEQVIYNGQIDHRDKFKPFYNFISQIPLANGHYEDVDASSTNENFRILGQKDLVNERAHVWVQHQDHNWGNRTGLGPNGEVIAESEVGLIVIPGFTPEANYQISWWDPIAK